MRDPSSRNVPLLAAVVPAADGREAMLARCLAAIRDATEPPDEVIVVDRPSGLRPASARNLGAMRTTAEVLVFVDADIVVHRDAFTRIRSAFRDDPGLTAVFGSYDDAPAAPGAVSGFRNLLHHHVHQSSPGRAITFWAGLGAIRREAFVAAGGFDPDLMPGPSVEDIEFGLRLADAGARVLLDPSLLGTHLKAWTLRDMIGTDALRRGAPWVALLLARRDAPAVLNLRWVHRVSAGAWVLALAAAGARRPRVSVGCLALVAVLNQSLYRLLIRQRGWREGLVGFGLHGLHHLVGAASIPLGIARHLRGRPQIAGRHAQGRAPSDPGLRGGSRPHTSTAERPTPSPARIRTPRTSARSRPS